MIEAAAAVQETRIGAGERVRIAVDTHVHLHPMFDHAQCLNAAIANAKAAGLANGPVWLLLTECAGVHAFRDLLERPPMQWRAHLRGERRTLELERSDGACVLVTAGRQVQLKEGLELLVLGTDADIPDGIALHEGLARAAAANALPVVPWGFGKWWGGRGRALAAFLDSPDGSRILLGDNGGRPGLWPRPAPFAKVIAAGRRVLPGSDPLPLPGQVKRIASYGLIATLDIDGETPFADLRTVLLDPATHLPVYGRRVGGFTFIHDQVTMQLVKKRKL